MRALCAAAVVEFGVAIVLVRGLEVELIRPVDAVQRLIAITLPRTTNSPALQKPVKGKPIRASRSLNRQSPRPAGPSADFNRTPAATSPASITIAQTSTLPIGGASGSGAGSGTGAGKEGGGAGRGTDLEQISGEITPRDYPRSLGNAGIGGRVGVLFIVGVNGRVTSCSVTRSSGVPELDMLTCRLIEERFRYRPSTDRFGRPVPDEVEGEHEWTAGG